MFSENDMQDLLDAVRSWIGSVDDNLEMTLRAKLLYRLMADFSVGKKSL